MGTAGRQAKLLNIAKIIQTVGAEFERQLQELQLLDNWNLLQKLLTDAAIGKDAEKMALWLEQHPGDLARTMPILSAIWKGEGVWAAIKAELSRGTTLGFIGAVLSRLNGTYPPAPQK